MNFEDIYPTTLGIAWIILGIILLLLGRLLCRVFMPYNVTQELVVRDNHAAGLTFTGYLTGMAIIFIGAAVGPEPTSPPTVTQVLWQMLTVAGYTIGGAVALAIGMVLVDKLVLTKFSVRKEIVDDQNVGTAAIIAGYFIATSLVIGGSVHGEGGGWWSALVFFGLGQVVLILFAHVYQWMTCYDLHAEVERDNVAAGTAFGLSIIALGIVLTRAVAGDFLSWRENLTDFAYYIVLGVGLLIVLQKVTDHLFMPGAKLDKEIAEDQNLNAAWIEGGLAIAVSAMVFFLL